MLRLLKLLKDNAVLLTVTLELLKEGIKYLKEKRKKEKEDDKKTED